MSSLLTLALLIVAAFVASAGLRSRSSYGLFSGAEYLLFGIAIGPIALGLVDDATLDEVRPSLTLATAWVGLLFGLRQRAGALRALGVRGLGAIAVETGGTLAAVAYGVPAVCALLGRPRDDGPAWSLAIVAAASTKTTLAWARQRLGADGPTTRLLAGVTRHDDVVTLGALAALAALHPPDGAPALWRAHAPVPGPLLALAAVVGLGLLLGLAFTLLGGRRPERGTAWVLLIGVVLLAAGLAARLSLPAVAVCFVLGATLSALTADHALWDDVDAATERPVVLLLLMVVGAHVRFAEAMVPAVAAALLVRVAAKLAAGPALAACGARTAWSGGGLLGFGGVALALAAEIDRLYGGALGAEVLATAGAMAVVGDLAGPLALRAVLARCGELPQAARTENLDEGVRA